MGAFPCLAGFPRLSGPRRGPIREHRHCRGCLPLFPHRHHGGSVTVARVTWPVSMTSRDAPGLRRASRPSWPPVAHPVLMRPRRRCFRGRLRQGARVVRAPLRSARATSNARVSGMLRVRRGPLAVPWPARRQGVPGPVEQLLVPRPRRAGRHRPWHLSPCPCLPALLLTSKTRVTRHSCVSGSGSSRCHRGGRVPRIWRTGLCWTRC